MVIEFYFNPGSPFTDPFEFLMDSIRQENLDGIELAFSIINPKLEQESLDDILYEVDFVYNAKVTDLVYNQLDKMGYGHDLYKHMWYMKH